MAQTLFMTSSEHRGELARLRVCETLGIHVTDSGRHLLRLRITPVICGVEESPSTGSRSYDEVFVAPHYVGSALSLPIREEPLPIHVFVRESGATPSEVIEEKDMTLLAWCDLYISRSRAESAAGAQPS